MFFGVGDSRYILRFNAPVYCDISLQSHKDTIKYLSSTGEISVGSPGYVLLAIISGKHNNNINY